MPCKSINCNKDCCPITDLVECVNGEIIGVDKSCNPQTTNIDELILEVIENNPPLSKLVIEEDKNGREGDISLSIVNNELVFDQSDLRQQLFKGWLIQHTVSVTYGTNSITTVVNKFNNEDSITFSISGGFSQIKIAGASPAASDMCAFLSPDITINGLDPSKKYSFLVNDDLGLSAYNNYSGMSDYGQRKEILLASTKNLFLNRKSDNIYNFTYVDKRHSDLLFMYANILTIPCGFGLPNGQITPMVSSVFMNPATTAPYSCDTTGNLNNSFLRRTTNNFLVVRILIIEEN